jgi:hypothetical protein
LNSIVWGASAVAMLIVGVSVKDLLDAQLKGRATPVKV